MLLVFSRSISSSVARKTESRLPLRVYSSNRQRDFINTCSVFCPEAEETADHAKENNPTPIITMVAYLDVECVRDAWPAVCRSKGFLSRAAPCCDECGQCVIQHTYFVDRTLEVIAEGDVGRNMSKVEAEKNGTVIEAAFEGVPWKSKREESEERPYAILSDERCLAELRRLTPNPLCTGFVVRITSELITIEGKADHKARQAHMKFFV
jgi:hypothetical protein